MGHTFDIEIALRQLFVQNINVFVCVFETNLLFDTIYGAVHKNSNRKHEEKK